MIVLDLKVFCNSMNKLSKKRIIFTPYFKPNGLPSGVKIEFDTSLITPITWSNVKENTQLVYLYSNCTDFINGTIEYSINSGHNEYKLNKVIERLKQVYNCFALPA